MRGLAGGGCVLGTGTENCDCGTRGVFPLDLLGTSMPNPDGPEGTGEADAGAEDGGGWVEGNAED